MTFGSAVLISLHAFVAWMVIEVFVNLAHRFSRVTYLVWHYLIVVAAFVGVFGLYHRFFDTGATAFAVTATAMSAVFGFEFIVFRFLYSGERWFLNWADWILPVFLATTSIYAVMTL